jgi:UTP-glucose-1-phosphate uridylyltransferase
MSAPSRSPVLLGDDIIDERDPLLTRMLQVQSERNCSVVG